MKQSACVPPSTSYAPRSKQQSKTPRGRTNFHHGHGAKRVNHDNQSQINKHQQPRDKFHDSEDDYFTQLQDEDDVNKILPRGSSDNGDDFDCADKPNAHKHKSDQVSEDDEEDPLDAYMKSLEKSEPSVPETSQSSDYELSTKTKNIENKTEAETTNTEKGIRLDIEDVDDYEESYYHYVEQNKGKKSSDTDFNDELEDRQNMVEYDRDGNIISVRKLKKEIDPLPPIDHSQIFYENFERCFYKEHEEISKLTDELVADLRNKLDIRVSGNDPPKPVCSFAHFGFDEQLMKVIRKSEYTSPTPIQAQAIPAALKGRNVLGIAMTGSGKTAAYLWPMIVHIMGQPDLKKGDGPIGLILVPTRELALQVYTESKRFANSYNIAVVCAYGGGSKYEQSKDLVLGAEIVVATPGRLIDMIKMNVTNLQRVTYLVLDEADRFFDMGFENQVRSICDCTRPDRQTLLFSATFKKKIEKLARTLIDNPVKIVQKALGEANEDVSQHFVILNEGPAKWNWLVENLGEFQAAGSLLIFVTRIVNSEELHNNLMEAGHDNLLLHGDMDQSERNAVMKAFKKKEKDIMVATDVAARGLDISHIRTVINYDVSRDIDTHVHRVGRTGRAGNKGDAYTLLTQKDKEFACHLVKNLESSTQEVPKDLMQFATQSHQFRKQRQTKGEQFPQHHGVHYPRRPDQGSTSGSGHRRPPYNESYNHNRRNQRHHNFQEWRNKRSSSPTQPHNTRGNDMYSSGDAGEVWHNRSGDRETSRSQSSGSHQGYDSKRSKWN